MSISEGHDFGCIYILALQVSVLGLNFLVIDLTAKGAQPGPKATTKPNNIAAAAAAVFGPGCATRPIKAARNTVCRLPPMMSHCLRPILSRNGIEAQLKMHNKVFSAPESPEAVRALRPM